MQITRNRLTLFPSRGRRSSLASIATVALISGSSFISEKPLLASALSTSSGTTMTTPSSSITVNSDILGARRLGNSDLIVSEACLGTMTYGVQNSQDDAFEQIDLARSYGINFIDTAELYPVPLFADEWRAGKTEEIVGNYISKIGSNERDELVIATKVAGYSPNSAVAAQRTVPPISEKQHYPDCRLDAKSVKHACDASLRRLQTDRIDLLQLHWPDRYVPLFGQMDYNYDNVREDSISIEETASALKDLIDEGKVRAIGLSNETPFGLCEWVRVCDKLGIRDYLASIQNSYNLLDRRFDVDMAEICHNYNIGLLPWSILAGGLLSGKYNNNRDIAKNSRFIKYPEYMKRWSPSCASQQTLDAVNEYSQIASNAGMTLTELSIEFIKSRQFVSKCGSTIIGATTIEQLEENIKPFLQFPREEENFTNDIIEAINKVHMKCRDPSCSL